MPHLTANVQEGEAGLLGRATAVQASKEKIQKQNSTLLEAA